MGLLILSGCAKAEVVARQPLSREPVALEAMLEAAEETRHPPALECPEGAELQESVDGDIVFCAEIRGHRMVLEGPVRWRSRLARKEGVLRLSGQFARGYPTGLWQESFARTGEPRARGEFAPVTDGPVIETYLGVSIGVMHMRLWNLEDQFWREPGLSIGGRRHGEWTVWYHTRKGEAKACEGRFFDDERHGKWQCWHSSGEAWWTGEYKSGEKDGSWTVNHPTGWLWAHVPMQADVPHGEYTRGHDDGVPAARGRYAHGKKVGNWTYWDEDGRRLRKDPWRLELPQFYPDASELQLLAHVEHGAPGERYGALEQLIMMEGRKEHDVTRELWVREQQRERAQAQGDESGKPVTAPTLGPMLLLALYDMKPDRYLRELRKLHSFRDRYSDSADRFMEKGTWQGHRAYGGLFDWVAETGYRLMLRGELPTGDAVEDTLVRLSRLVDSPSLANRRRAAEVFAKFEGAPSFDPEVFPGIPFENTGRAVIEWLRANLERCKWNRKDELYRCSPAAP